MKLFPALFSHYRRHPLQLLALAIMIVVATTLWSSISYLTGQARASLGQSEQMVSSHWQVERVDGQALTVADFAHLRRAGLCVMPWLEVDRPAPAGRLVGIDPLSAACFSAGGRAAGKWNQPLDGKPFMDISKAAELTENEPESVISTHLSLLLSDLSSQLPLPSAYRKTGFAVGPDTGELGESFLLNLDALGILVLLITALLLRSVYQLGIAQRRDSVVLLRRFGVQPSVINRLLVLEVVLLAGLCVVPGVGLGRLLAASIGSGFSEALDSLFDIPLYAGQGESWLMPVLTMMAVVVAVCSVDLLRPPGRVVYASARRYRALCACLMLLVGLALAVISGSLWQIYSAVALVFIGAGGLAPGLIAGANRWLAVHCAESPLVRWRYRELGVLARRLALPLVALQFALATVLAVQALVTVFEATFDEWLGQRLSADYFIRVPEGASDDLAAEWLQSQPALEETGQWHRVIRGKARVRAGIGQPEQTVDLVALGPIDSLLTDWTLQSATDAPWITVAEGRGVMINEQEARRRNLSVGDTLTVTLADRLLSLPVAGIYADYGRPAGEVLVHASVLPKAFVPVSVSFSINPGNFGIESVKAGLRQLWQVRQLSVQDNRRARALADAVFDNTFMLTRAMTFITLVLAAISLLVMGWVFFTTRAWYFRLLLVWGLGRRQVAGQLTRLAVILTAGIALLALPLGTWLSWVLVHRINPLAFGWSLPMMIYPSFWLELGVLSLLIGLSIALLMSAQLRRPVAMPASANRASGGER
jgi:putative ABC transport system permease protein